MLGLLSLLNAVGSVVFRGLLGCCVCWTVGFVVLLGFVDLRWTVGFIRLEL